VASIDRGISATDADMAAINSAIQIFESVAPCALGDAELVAYLRGRWRLAYSSSLVRAARTIAALWPPQMPRLQIKSPVVLCVAR